MENLLKLHELSYKETYLSLTGLFKTKHSCVFELFKLTNC